MLLEYYTRTPLHSACLQGHAAVVSVLLEEFERLSIDDEIISPLDFVDMQDIVREHY